MNPFAEAVTHENPIPLEPSDTDAADSPPAEIVSREPDPDPPTEPIDQAAFDEVARDWATKVIISRRPLSCQAEYTELQTAEAAAIVSALVERLSLSAPAEYLRRASLDEDEYVTAEVYAVEIATALVAATTAQLAIDSAALELLSPGEGSVMALARVRQLTEPILNERTVDVVFRGLRRKVTYYRPPGA